MRSMRFDCFAVACRKVACTAGAAPIHQASWVAGLAAQVGTPAFPAPLETRVDCLGLAFQDLLFNRHDTRQAQVLDPRHAFCRRGVQVSGISRGQAVATFHLAALVGQWWTNLVVSGLKLWELDNTSVDNSFTICGLLRLYCAEELEETQLT